MLLGDIINGKEKSHLVLVHGECFSLHFLYRASEDIFSKNLRRLAQWLDLRCSMQFITLKLMCYLYATPLQTP